MSLISALNASEELLVSAGAASDGDERPKDEAGWRCCDCAVFIDGDIDREVGFELDGVLDDPDDASMENRSLRGGA